MNEDGDRFRVAWECIVGAPPLGDRAGRFDASDADGSAGMPDPVGGGFGPGFGVYSAVHKAGPRRANVRPHGNEGMTSMHAERTPSPSERRTRILGALEDGEYRATGVVIWTELSPQAVSADLRWLQREGFASAGVSEGRDGRSYPHWDITDKGREYLASLSDEEKDW